MKKYLVFIFTLLVVNVLSIKVVNATVTLRRHMIETNAYNNRYMQRGEEYIFNLYFDNFKDDVNNCLDVEINTNSELLVNNKKSYKQTICSINELPNTIISSFSINVETNNILEDRYSSIIVKVTDTNNPSETQMFQQDFIIYSPVIDVTITPDKEYAKVGDIVDWVITVENRREIPFNNAGIIYDFFGSKSLSDSGFDITNNNFSYRFGKLESGETKTLRIQSKVNSNMKADSKAILEIIPIFSNRMPIDFDNSIKKEITIKEPNIITESTLDKSAIKPNEEYSFKFRIKNNSLVDSGVYKIILPIDSKLKIIKAEGATISGNNLTYSLSSIKSNETKEYTIVVKLIENSKENDDLVKEPEIKPGENNTEQPNNDNKKDENSADEKIENPQTNDNNFKIYITIIFISLLGMILSINYVKSKKFIYKI